MLFRRKQRSWPADAEHTPLLALWYQARTAIADLITPVLASLKTLWLLLFAPLAFFRAAYFSTRSPDRLLSPFDPVWRVLSPKTREPLDPAQFLLFGILAAALAGFNFDNSNRLTGLLQKSGAVDALLSALANQSPGLGELIVAGQAFFQNEVVIAVSSFLDLSVVAAVLELIVNLFLIMVFAYLFYLLAGRQISATHSYSFWLYVTGLQFVSTAVAFIFFSIFSLSTFGLPEIAPDLLFWLLDAGIRLYWHYLLPAFLLPRIFFSLTARRVVLAALVGRGVLAGLGWLFTIGLITVAILIGAFM